MILAGLAVVFLLPYPIWGDGVTRYHQLDDLLMKGRLEGDKYSIVGPLFSAPLWLMGKAFGDPAGWCKYYNAALFALGVLLLYVMLRDRIPRRLLRTFILLLVYASMFPAHAVAYYGEVYTAIVVMLGTVAVLAGRRLSGWTAVVLGVANTPGALMAMTTMSAKRWWDTRRLRVALAVAAAVAVIMLENWIRRGGPLRTGYEENDRGPVSVMPYSGLPGFSYPIFFGLLSLIFSFGKGLLFFAPGLFLPARERITGLSSRVNIDLVRLYGLWMAFTVGLLLLYAHFWGWSGAVFYGPRYLLFASVPASFVLAVRLYRPDTSVTAGVVTVCALGMSIWAGTAGAVFWDVDGECFKHDPSYHDPLCYYTPEFSSLWFPFVHQLVLSFKAKVILVLYLAVGAYVMSRPLVHLIREAWPSIRQRKAA